MSLTANTTHLLDDFLESIEGLPTELKVRLEELASKDIQFEALFKKRNLYLRAEEKGLDATLQAVLLRKTEKEHAKLLTIIEEKIAIETRLQSLVEQHLTHLEKEVTTKFGMNLENPYSSVFSDIPDVEPNITPCNRSRSSPKRRQTLQDEPIDPNEPVYCYCRQVSHGDMIACDNPNCALEWFHYPCVGLNAPPKGKWFCKNCKPPQE